MVGPDALQDEERLLLETGKLIREGFLQQNAFHEVDGTCPLKKTLGMIKLIRFFYDQAREALHAKVPVEEIISLDEIEEITRIKELPVDQFETKSREIEESIKQKLSAKVKV